MYSLFIDTHDKEIILALAKENKICFEKKVQEKQNHSTLCMPLLASLLKEANITCQNLDAIYVVNGPGSFTGERLGVTIAKTLAYCLNIPIRTISSLELSVASITINSPLYFSLEEKNGYFIAKFNKQKELVSDYQYLTKKEYNEFIKTNEVKQCTTYDIEKVLEYAMQKEEINPHMVNPFYVKKLEVE